MKEDEMGCQHGHGLALGDCEACDFIDGRASFSAEMAYAERAKTYLSGVVRYVQRDVDELVAQFNAVRAEARAEAIRDCVAVCEAADGAGTLLVAELRALLAPLEERGQQSKPTEANKFEGKYPPDTEYE
jgi:hypothetical protein